ncbi:MAG TPA: efflux RND transporter periplasmic adaptor subunit [Rhizomicrobium sp.]|nr:efflux RND transporter periplasmic adaptor subunit [Rhizomicrobium sp.]
MMPDQHRPTQRGWAFVVGGVGLGVLLVILLVTKGFGLFGEGSEPAEQAGLIRKGERIFIPDGSALRGRIVVKQANESKTSATLTLPGIVESDPAHTAAVLTPFGGRVVRIAVSLGDRVAKDQLLAVIDSPDLAQAYDDFDKASDALALAEKNLARQEGQFKIGAASSRDLDQARSDHVQARAEFARTRARLGAIGASISRHRQTPLLEVRAPTDGSITALSIAGGNMINDPTQPIMTVADLNTIWVAALVPEKDIAAVHKNDDAQVRLEAYPDHPLGGKVLFVPDAVEPDTRRLKIRIAFANPGYLLKPNMFATVELQGRSEPRIMLPTSALLMNNDRTSVFVAVAPWTFERRIVNPELQEGETVLIDSGLKAGESVVVKGGIFLND